MLCNFLYILKFSLTKKKKNNQTNTYIKKKLSTKKLHSNILVLHL